MLMSVSGFLKGLKPANMSILLVRQGGNVYLAGQMVWELIPKH